MTATPEALGSSSADRRALFVAGSGRSGTSALACTLQILGMHVPQPEVVIDDTNPKGFGESQWVVDFHDRLLRRANVAVADARPQAWFDTGKLNTNERHRERAKAWLQEQFTDPVNEVVIKDPRLAWFIGLWRSAALRNDVVPVYAVMLRAPAEVIGSKEKYYSAAVSPSSRAASWVNHMLHTERATRGFRRSFVNYLDLLEDWTVPVYRLGESLDLQAVKGASARDLRRVHDFIDPDLRRVRKVWDDVEIPLALREVVDETWHHLRELAGDSGKDNPETHAVLDQVREAYTKLYEEAEGMAESTALAARRKAERRPADPEEPSPMDEATHPLVEATEVTSQQDASAATGARRRRLIKRRNGA